MTKRDFSIIGITAAITAISLTLPGLLWQRGLSLSWTLGLMAAILAAAVLGYLLARRLG